ncbi:MAG: hypothetical protein WBV82_03620 [Myxococcaceae bacterium]
MYATVRRYAGVVDPAKAAERVRDGFVPLIRGINGLIAYYWIDAGGGVMVSTSVFESQAAAEESNRKAAEWVKANLTDVLPNRPEFTAGTVVATSEAEHVSVRQSMAATHEAATIH